MTDSSSLINIRLENLIIKAGKIILLSVPELNLSSGLTFISGETGSGKTTLMKALCLLKTPASGKMVWVHKNDFPDETFSENNLSLWSEHFLAINRRHIGYLPQSGGFIPWLDVLTNMMFPLSHTFGLKESQNKALYWLDKAGLSHTADRSASSLSGGQMRRMLTARACASEPDLLLLDEPMNGLDESWRSWTMNIIEEQKKRGIIVVLAAHEKPEVFSPDKFISVLSSENSGEGHALLIS